jgi:PIN domain nuclease of toxin-antitoxin system
VILLVDANALLWWLANDKTLDQGAARSIIDPANDVLVSAATIWEIEVKRAAGRLQAPPDLVEDLNGAKIGTVPLTAGDAVAAARLPTHHKDPFDRMLVAQALRLDATIVSRDRAFDQYGIPRLAA